MQLFLVQQGILSTRWKLLVIAASLVVVLNFFILRNWIFSHQIHEEIPAPTFSAPSNESLSTEACDPMEMDCLAEILPQIDKICINSKFFPDYSIFRATVFSCTLGHQTKEEVELQCHCDCIAGHGAYGGTACFTDGTVHIPCKCNHEEVTFVEGNATTTENGVMAENYATNECDGIIKKEPASICDAADFGLFDYYAIECFLSPCELCALDCRCNHGAMKYPFGECSKRTTPEGSSICKCLY